MRTIAPGCCMRSRCEAGPSSWPDLSLFFMAGPVPPLYPFRAGRRSEVELAPIRGVCRGAATPTGVIPGPRIGVRGRLVPGIHSSPGSAGSQLAQEPAAPWTPGQARGDAEREATPAKRPFQPQLAWSRRHICPAAPTPTPRRGAGWRPWRRPEGSRRCASGRPRSLGWSGGRRPDLRGRAPPDSACSGSSASGRIPA